MKRREFIKASAFAVGGLRIAGDAQADAEVRVCPKSGHPARTVFATRLEELISYGWDMRLTLTCLQGIVNRSQPRLYLIHDRYDELWLDWLQERGDVDKVEWLEVGRVFERFLPEVSRMFVTDPAIPGSINVATMLAGVHGGLVATPATADQYDLPRGEYPDSPRDGLDLREMHWSKDVEAYRWAYQKFGSSLSRQAVAILDPAEVALRDYLVEFKIPILWISGPQDIATHPAASPEEEKQVARDVMMKWPPNIPCLGWPGTHLMTAGIGETPGVDLASECAKYFVVTANDGHGATVGNLSIHSGTSAKLRQQPPAPIKLERDKVYICFIGCDGDGPNFVRSIYRKLNQDPRHQRLPIAWEFELAGFDLMADIIDYFYKTAHSGDGFVCALTGLGYIHEERYGANYPPEQREKILKDYIELSGRYRAKFDTTALRTFAEMSQNLLARFATTPGIKSVFANYGRTHETNLENLITEIGGVPVFRAVNPGYVTTRSPDTPSARRAAKSFQINEIKRWTPQQRPCFLHISLVSWLTDIGMVEDIVRGLGSEYVPVEPDQLVSLYREHKSRLT